MRGVHLHWGQRMLGRTEPNIWSSSAGESILQFERCWVVRPPSCGRPARAAQSSICAKRRRSGSGANGSAIGDDDRMQPFGPVEALFKARHFDGQIIIILCVSWYTSFKLSLRDLVIMMADRGIALTHTTILR